MTNVVPAATPGPTGPPWNANDTLYFYDGPLSNFAATPGLRLPLGYHRHNERDRVPVRTLEHWFQACKATSRQQFDLILASGSAQAAKRAGRQTALRPDWEHVKYQVMLCGLRGKFAMEPYRSALLLTHPRPLAEDSPTDFVWGCRDAHGGYHGHNLSAKRSCMFEPNSSPTSAPASARSPHRAERALGTRPAPAVPRAIARPDASRPDRSCSVAGGLCDHTSGLPQDPCRPGTFPFAQHGYPAHPVAHTSASARQAESPRRRRPLAIGAEHPVRREGAA